MPSPTPTALPLNIMQFARILRRAGLPIGPGKVITALEALQVIDISNRDDVYWALHSVLVKRHAHSELFRLAFDRFWIAPDAPSADASMDEPSKPHATEPSGHRRRAAKLFRIQKKKSPSVGRRPSNCGRKILKP